MLDILLAFNIVLDAITVYSWLSPYLPLLCRVCLLPCILPLFVHESIGSPRSPGSCRHLFEAVSALFRTSLKCSPDEEVVEPEIEAEPLSPTKPTAATAFEATPYPKIALAPPAAAIRCEAMAPATVDIEIKNNGGAAGEYHICDDTVPEWMSLDENCRGNLAPGETARLVITVDKDGAAAAAVAVAAMATGREIVGHEPIGEQQSACAVLRVEVDSGGSGSLLPIVCSFDDELVAGILTDYNSS